MRPPCHSGSFSEEMGAARAAPYLTACLLRADFPVRRAMGQSLLGAGRSRVQAWLLKMLLITITSLTCLWLLFVSQSFHFILSEALEETLLLCPLGSTPLWHVSSWCGESEPFLFEGTRTKSCSSNSARAFCMNKVCLVHTTSIPIK